MLFPLSFASPTNSWGLKKKKNNNEEQTCELASYTRGINLWLINTLISYILDTSSYISMTWTSRDFLACFWDCSIQMELPSTSEGAKWLDDLLLDAPKEKHQKKDRKGNVKKWIQTGVNGSNNHRSVIIIRDASNKIAIVSPLMLLSAWCVLLRRALFRTSNTDCFCLFRSLAKVNTWAAENMYISRNQLSMIQSSNSNCIQKFKEWIIKKKRFDVNAYSYTIE